ALRLEPFDLGDLARGQDLGDHALDADLGGRPFGRLAAVAGEEDGREPELLQRRDRLGARRLHGVANREPGAWLAVPGDRDRPVRAADLDLAALDGAPYADTGHVAEGRDRGELTQLARGGLRDRLRDRMLRRGLDRACEPQDLRPRRAVQR